MKLIYTDNPTIKSTQGVTAYDISSCSWRPMSDVQMTQIEVRSPDSHERATKLCAYENKLFETAGLADIRYTLLVGPEDEQDARRLFRVMILRGIVMPVDGRIKKQRPPAQQRSRRPLPPGVILDER